MNGKEHLLVSIVRDRVLKKIGNVINDIEETDNLPKDTPVFIVDGSTGHVFLSLLTDVIPLGPQIKRNVLAVLNGGLISFPPNPENTPAELVDCLFTGNPPVTAIISDGEFLKKLLEDKNSTVTIKEPPCYTCIQRPTGTIDVYAQPASVHPPDELP